jgi:putative hemin transport protein
MLQSQLYQQYLVYKQQYPKLRDKRLAQKIGISEGELLVLRLGSAAVSLPPACMHQILVEMCSLGYLLCVNRNNQAISESKGYFTTQALGANEILLSSDTTSLIIDSTQVSHIFALSATKQHANNKQFHANSTQRHSLQLCNASGYVVAKIYLEEPDKTTSFTSLTSKFTANTPVITFKQQEHIYKAPEPLDQALAEQLRNCADIAALVKLLSVKNYSLSTSCIDVVTQVEHLEIVNLLTSASDEDTPIIVKVSNSNAISIYSGTVVRTKATNGCFNVLDERFHLHLYQEKIASVYKIQLACNFANLEILESATSTGEIVSQLIKISSLLI